MPKHDAYFFSPVGDRAKYEAAVKTVQESIEHLRELDPENFAKLPFTDVAADYWKRAYESYFTPEQRELMELEATLMNLDSMAESASGSLNREQRRRLACQVELKRKWLMDKVRELRAKMELPPPVSLIAPELVPAPESAAELSGGTTKE